MVDYKDFNAATPQQRARMIVEAGRKARGQEPPPEDNDETAPGKKTKKKFFDENGDEVDPFADDENDQEEACDKDKTKAMAARIIQAGRRRRGEIV